MALIKKKNTDFGIPADYWKIGMITIDRTMKEASFSLNLFIDKDAKQFLETYTVSSLMGLEDKTLFNKYFEIPNNYINIYNACYEYAKDNEDFFKDAISDNE